MGDERETVPCYFCLGQATKGRPVNQPQVHYVKCRGCTPYAITDDAIFEMEPNPFTPRERANASGWLREHRDSIIDASQVAMLRSLATPAPVDKAGKLFDFLLVACPEHGKWYELDFGTPELRSAAWAESAQELDWLLSEVLVAQLQLLEKREDIVHEQFMMTRITPRGWQVLEQRKELSPPKRPLGFTS